jgi:predicted transcriptional regulator
MKKQKMEIEKGKTYKYLRDKRGVSETAKEKLKRSNKIKKSILKNLEEGDMTIDQITDKIQLPKDEVVFYMMSLLKYGDIKTGEIDDMDEYFTYKLNK